MGSQFAGLHGWMYLDTSITGAFSSSCVMQPLFVIYRIRVSQFVAFLRARNKLFTFLRAVSFLSSINFKMSLVY